MRVSGLETRSKALESTLTSLQMRSMMVNGRMERSGRFEKSERNGLGVMDFHTGARVEGQWKDGKLNGPAKMKYSNMDFYDGEWYIIIQYIVQDK